LTKKKRTLSIDQLPARTAEFIAYEKSRDLSPRSLKELRAVLNKLGDFAREQDLASLESISAATLKDFLLHQNPSGSPAQSKMLIWVLRKFFAWLVLSGDLPHNPAGSLVHPKICKREHLPEYLSPEELDALMATAFSAFSIKEATIIALMTTTGLRPKEVAGLQVRDINIAEQLIYGKVKGGWYKRGPITAAMAQQFQLYFDQTGIDAGPVFRNAWNDHIDTSWIRRMVRQVAQKAHIERNVTPKMLRHTFATYAAQRHGKSVTRALLGHCDTGHATEVYMHLLPERFGPLAQMHPFGVELWRPDAADKAGSNLSAEAAANEAAHKNAGPPLPAVPLPAKTEKSIADFLEYYGKVRNVTAATIKSVKSMCFRWARFLYAQRGGKSLKHAAAEDVVAWIAFQQSLPHIKAVTIEHQLCVIRTLHDYLVNFEGPATAPCKGLPAFICRSSYERSYLTVDEVFALLGGFDKSDPVQYQQYLMIALLWCTGLRTNEFLSLLWKDINLKEGIVRVRVGKGRKERLIFLNARMHKALQHHRKKILAASDAPVFVPLAARRRPDALPRPFSAAQLSSVLKNAAKHAGLSRKVTPMTMRHTFATHLYEAGVDIKDIQEMMGHSNTEETTIYIHVTVEAAKRLLNEHVYHTLQLRGANE
jgi:site-specific recombinase XerD